MSETDIGKRLNSIEARLSAIEGILTPTVSQPNSLANQPQKDKVDLIDPWTKKILEQKQSTASSVVSSTTASSQPQTSSWAKQISAGGSRWAWLGLIGIICFVFAAGLLIKLTIDSGWFTPTRQIFAAALFGIALIGCGFALLKRDLSYASLLPAAGIIILYLDAFAAVRLYSLVELPAGLVSTGVIAAICIWLQTKFRHQIYSLTAAVGSYLSPLIMDLGLDDNFAMGYFLVCNIAFGIIAIFLQTRILTIISCYLAIILSGAIGGYFPNIASVVDVNQVQVVAANLAQNKLLALALFANFIVGIASVYLYTVRSKTTLSEEEGWSFLPVLLIFYGFENQLLMQITPTLAPWISICFGLLVLGVYFAARRFFPQSLGSRGVVIAFSTLVFAHALYFQILRDEERTWLLPISMVLYGLLPKIDAFKKADPHWQLPRVVISLIIVVEYFKLIWHLGEHDSNYYDLVALIAIASMWFARLRNQGLLVSDNKLGNALLYAAHFMAIVTLFKIAGSDGSLIVSILWLLYAIFVISIGFKRQDSLMAKSALLVLVFAAAKVLLFDASGAPTIVRIVCLFITGVVLYGSGIVLRKIDNWQLER
ncbi:MAG: hypothetical protein FD163_1202 [Hyphomonadaceae bacterium]|nr:MAG: hypothetical protein FD163_1202 [Hyphomonadaceae bacterium]